MPTNNLLSRPNISVSLQGNRIKFHRGETSSTQKHKEREKIMKQESILQIAQVFRAIRRIAPTLFFVSFVTSWFKSF